MFDHLAYDHHIDVSRTVPGKQDPVTGVPLPGTTTTVLTAPCDAQASKVRLSRLRVGDEYLEADATVYLADHANVGLCRTDDDVVVEMGRTLYPGKVLLVDQLENALIVRWV